MTQEQPPISGRSKVCWFCGVNLSGGRNGNTSREHVIALWLQEELGIYTGEIRPTWHEQPLGELLDERRQTWGGLLAGRVCMACNNGWMSQLEDAARPILLPLVRGERSVADIGAVDRLTLARWAAKTAFTLSASVQENRIPVAHYRSLYETGEVPPGIFVLAASEKELSERAAYTVDGTWLMSHKVDSEPGASAVKETSYKTYLQLGRLVLLVLWWPLEPHWVLSFEKDLYERLCPVEAKVMFHPAPKALPPEIQEAAGPDLMHQLDYNSDVVGLRYTQSVKAIHLEDFPAWVLESFGIEPIKKQGEFG